jgi:hypothetical protein
MEILMHSDRLVRLVIGLLSGRLQYVSDDNSTEAIQRRNQEKASSILNRFDAEQTEHAGIWSAMHRNVPRRLHHYTTLGGLQGILESGALWASDVRFMNDSSELTYASTLIDEVVMEVLHEVEESDLRAALPLRNGFANSFEFGAQPFITCFCENDDLLSQWRGYGVKDASVSLGFDLSLIAAVRDLPPNTYLRKVVYDEEQQRTEVRTVVRTWLQTVRTMLADGENLSDLFPYPAIWAIQQALIEHHLCFKHPTFSEENEWRLIKLVDVRAEVRLQEQLRTDKRMEALGVPMPRRSAGWPPTRAEGIDVKFRQSTVGLTPYVELELKDRAGIFTDRLPLWEAVLGPSANPKLALESLDMYLESRGYGAHTEVRASGIPLRR